MSGREVDSYAVIFHGPRGSGKSGSMAVESGIKLIEGRRVFADSPVAFDLEDDLGDGGITHYATEPMDYEEFMFILEDDGLKKKYKRAVVAWDEIDKRLSNRNWQSMYSKIMGQFFTYIGKLEMTFLMTAQFIDRVDLQLRLQIDAEVGCMDMSFEYTNLARGSWVSRTLRDVSGRYTGRMFKDTGREYFQTLHLQPFWPWWDTLYANSILEAWRKVQIKQDVKTFDMTHGVNGGFGEDDEERKTDKNKNSLIIRNLVEEIKNNSEPLSRVQILTMARQRGYKASDYILFKELVREDIVPVGGGKYTEASCV
jgi:hypothetical protein